MSTPHRDSKYRDDDDDSDDGNVYKPEEFLNEDNDNDHDRGRSDPYNDPVPEEPRREFKYSTANMNSTGQWKKWCMILLTFLIMMAFMIALSVIMQKVFFDDTSDNAPNVPVHDPNGTFPLDKSDIASACSQGTINADDGKLCRAACEPQFFNCCDPFDEYELYNLERPENYTQEQYGVDSFGPNETEKNLTNCALDTELRGCMAYAKCQALRNKRVLPAPATLFVHCSPEKLKEDPVSCQELCKTVKCCYSDKSDNCMADNIDICMDYAPCQNLRTGYNLPTAPDDLDQKCLWQDPECNTICKEAECCGDPNSLCLQVNFMACLTYAPCNDVTRTSIKLAPQFSFVRDPPDELREACGNYHSLSTSINNQNMAAPAEKNCTDICSEVQCCWASKQSENCFYKDPLGCLAWEQQCQVLLKD